MITNFKIFEKLSIKDRVLTFLLKCLNNDKKDYKYVWNDIDWLYTEFMNFIDKDFTSYIYREYHNKLDYNIIENILIEEYPDIYADAIKTVFNMSLEDYLIKKDSKKYNI